jgi:hypothetical protein
MTEKNDSKQEEKATTCVSHEIAAVQTVDDLAGAHSRVEGSINYFKKKFTFQGKLLGAWKREFKIPIPEGAGLPELEKVLRIVAGKYHQATTLKHLAECAKLSAESRAQVYYDTKVGELTAERGTAIYKGKKINTSTPVEKAKRMADADPEIIESRRQALMADMSFKMWISILSSLRLTADIAQSLQMGQMSENRLLSMDKSSTMIQGRDVT